MWRTVWYKFSVLICGMSFKPQQSASMTLSNSSHVPRGKEQSALSWPLSQTDNPWKPGQPSSLKPYMYSFRYTLRAGAVNLPTRQASPARDTSLCHASPLSAFSLVLDPPDPQILTIPTQSNKLEQCSSTSQSAFAVSLCV